MNLERLTLHLNSFKTVHVKWFCNSVFQGWRLYYLNILLLTVFSCIVVSEKRIRWSCSLSVLADLCLKTQGIQRAFAAPWSRSAEGFNEIGNKEGRSTYRWQTSPCVFLSRSYTVLNPSFSCLCNFGFGWQPPFGWLGVDRTQLILLDIQGAVAIGIFIQQLKRFFLMYILIFTVSSICCLMISWLLWHWYQNPSVWSSCSYLFPPSPKAGL